MSRLGDRLIDILLGWLLLAGTLATAALLGVGMWLLTTAIAGAHEAPSGWRYPYNCCHDNDCAQIPDAAVERTATHYVVRLTPADHPMLTRSMSWHVMATSDQLRDSEDGHYHACISGEAPDGYQMSGPAEHRLICLFVPGPGV